MHKDDLRRQIRQIKRQFTPQQLEALSLPIVARLKARLSEAQTVLAYYSLPDEVNTHQLLDDLLAEGKNVLLPKVLDDENMEIRRYTGRHDLQEGILHLMEPIGETFTAYGDIDMVVVPGMAFDAQGHRLGRGRGYYDRFFTLHSIPEHSSPTRSLSRFTTLGVCFDFQKVDEVPVDAFDIAVDEVI